LRQRQSSRSRATRPRPQTLAAVKARGALLCGVNQGLPGFSYADERGQWSSFDVDFCRAVAAAVFHNPNKVKLVPLTADARFQALKYRKIDVLSRNSTWTMGREVGYGLAFVGVTLYDGQGFMAPRAMRVTSANELDGARICVLSGTVSALRRASQRSFGCRRSLWRCSARSPVRSDI
jgi:general L-amino acid transport system substrate-binding protein